jgi:hypothetical protein
MPLSTDPTLLSLLRSTHTATVRAVLTDSSNAQYDLVITGGSVTIDARRGARRSLSLDVLDTDGTLTGNGYNSALAPFGARIAVYRGVLDPLTQTTPSNLEVQVGDFIVTSVSMKIDEAGVVMASVSAEDGAYAIGRTKFKQALEIPASTRISNVSDSSPGALQRILDNLSGPLSFTRALPTISTTINYKWVGSDPAENPWTPMTLLAQAVGYEIYFNSVGQITASVVPSLVGSADWSYLQDESNVVLSISRTLDAEEIINGVQMAGQDSKTGKVWAEAYQTTGKYGTGTLGIRPIKFDSPYVRNDTVAQTACTRLLNAYIGQPIEWTMIPNPAMDVRDRVRLVDTRLNLDVTALVDAITLPLDAGGSMTVRGRVA